MDTVRLSLGENELLLDHLLEKGIAIAHDCGGALACSSCCIVIAEGAQALPAPSEDELDMLERAGAAAPGARLACQVSGPGELRVALPRQEAPVRAESSPVSLTPRAAKYLSQQLKKHPGAVAVRLRVEPAGCSGYAYRLDPADSIGAGDALFEAHGVRLVVERASLPYLQGASVDFAREGLARRLRFDNPNARQSCGCGESFAV